MNPVKVFTAQKNAPYFLFLKEKNPEQGFRSVLFGEKGGGGFIPISPCAWYGDLKEEGVVRFHVFVLFR